MRAVGVVVPVHDEQDVLARCLDALAVAAAAAGTPVHVTIVLDACTDRSAEVAADAGNLATTTAVLAIDERNVGAARAHGCAALLGAQQGAGLWLASTDADSAVGPSWLARQLDYGDAGYDAVAGTVTIEDWTRYPDDVRRRYLRGYSQRWDHRHIHGANLGVRADAYAAVGGFPALRAHEDVALIAALAAARRPIAWADDVPVRTSARRRGRAPSGMSAFLHDLATATGRAAALG